jgi:diketogulonate reductase-like aldo/keto reductase
MALTIGSALPLNSGTRIPVLGFGVWQLQPGAVTRKSVGEALKVGYRHIDTAKIYGNEADVGEAVRASGLHRSEVFVTTKVWNGDQGYASTLAACDESLAKLGLGYIDLYLIHWPLPAKGADTWRALEKLKADNKCRAIGVSNYEVRELDELGRQSQTVPAADQVEFNPFHYLKDVEARCKQAGMVLEAYSPLSRGQALGNPKLRAIAAKVGRSPAQVMLRWGLQHGAVVLPRSSKRDHIRENAQVFDFELARDVMAALDGLG